MSWYWTHLKNIESDASWCNVSFVKYCHQPVSFNMLTSGATSLQILNIIIKLKWIQGIWGTILSILCNRYEVGHHITWSHLPLFRKCFVPSTVWLNYFQKVVFLFFCFLPLLPLICLLIEIPLNNSKAAEFQDCGYSCNQIIVFRYSTKLTHQLGF